MLITATELLVHGGWEHGHGYWWPIFPLFWVLFWGLLIFGLFRFRRGGRGHHRHSAEDILAETYARGDISVDEYRERLSVLRERRSR